MSNKLVDADAVVKVINDFVAEAESQLNCHDVKPYKGMADILLARIERLDWAWHEELEKARKARIKELESKLEVMTSPWQVTKDASGIYVESKLPNGDMEVVAYKDSSAPNLNPNALALLELTEALALSKEIEDLMIEQTAELTRGADAQSLIRHLELDANHRCRNYQSRSRRIWDAQRKLEAIRAKYVGENNEPSS